MPPNCHSLGIFRSPLPDSERPTKQGGLPEFPGPRVRATWSEFSVSVSTLREMHRDEIAFGFECRCMLAGHENSLVMTRPFYLHFADSTWPHCSHTTESSPSWGRSSKVPQSGQKRSDPVQR